VLFPLFGPCPFPGFPLLVFLVPKKKTHRFFLLYFSFRPIPWPFLHHWLSPASYPTPRRKQHPRVSSPPGGFFLFGPGAFSQNLEAPWTVLEERPVHGPPQFFFFLFFGRDRLSSSRVPSFPCSPLYFFTPPTYPVNIFVIFLGHFPFFLYPPLLEQVTISPGFHASHRHNNLF